MRTRLALTVAVAVAAVAAATASAATAPIKLTPVGRTSFPVRAFLVALPRHVSVGSAAVRVRENGKPVSDVTFVPLAQSSKQFGVVIAIDASNSMRGVPLKRAFAASRSLATGLGRLEAVGVVSFNSGAHVLQPLSRVPDAVDATLQRIPKTQEGTHIYDAAARALDLLQAQSVAGGSIVLLSDGADTGSTTSAAAVLQRARMEHVRIFTIGLRTRTFRPFALRALAAGSGASYAEASSPAELDAIYRSLSARLADEYVLRYRSSAKVGSAVSVAVQIQGMGSAALSYVAPAPHSIAPYRPTILSRFWAWRESFVVIAIIAALFVLVAVRTALRRPGQRLTTRLSPYVTLATPATERPSRPRQASPSDRLGSILRRRTAHAPFWTRLREELRIAEIAFTAEQIVVATAAMTLVVFLAILLLAPVFSVFALAVPLTVRELIARRLKEVRARFADQLPDTLQVLASALRAGHSFAGALSVVVENADDPTRHEFARVVADAELGRSVESSLRDVARRMDSDVLEQVALVAELQQRAGGNTAEVLDRVVDTIRAKFDLRRLAQTLTAQGRLARWIVTLLPPALAGLILLVNPGYLSPLTSTTGGQAALVVATAMVVAGSLVIKRIVEVKV